MSDLLFHHEKMANAAVSSSVAASAPTASPPPGMPLPTQEDFVYSPTQAKATIAFGAIVTILTLVSVAARLYTHKFIIRRVRIDDVWAVIAMVAVLVVNILQSIFVSKYLPSMTSMSAGDAGAKIAYSIMIVYNIAMASLKMTFLFQFYQIFRYVYVMRIVYTVAIFIVAAWSIAQIFLAVFVCVPIEANWNHSLPQPKCLPSFVATYINSSGTILTDVIVLFLPFPTIFSLKLRMRQLWAVFGILGIGAIVPIISAGRIHSLTNPPPKGYLSTACWTIAEIGVGVITASLATIRHIRDRKMRSLLSTSLSGTQRDNVSQGVLQGPTQQIPHHMTGSQVDLIGQNQSAVIGSPDSIFKPFHKKQGSRATTFSYQDPLADLTANEGTTNTIITSSRRKRRFRRRKEEPMAAGAANFLGEFGVLVERTWEVQEIRME